MKALKKRSVKSLVAACLVVCLIFCSSFVFASEKEVCDKALIKCGVDALIAGVLSGAQTFLLLYSGCLMGYTWCLKYYMPKI
jgi:hypothetical protein